jgi:hypothetical protein
VHIQQGVSSTDLHSNESAFYIPELYDESREYPNTVENFLKKVFAKTRENTVHGIHKLKDHKSTLKALSQLHRGQQSP